MNILAETASYQDLKHPTRRQNFDDTSGQISKLILTLRHTKLAGWTLI